MRGLALLALAVMVPACRPGTSPAPVFQPGASGPSPDSIATALTITSADQLIGGVGAKGRIGDVLLQNTRIRVIVAAIGRGEGYQPYGGIILDADRRRTPGEPGRSRFGEVITSLDLDVEQPTSITITQPGGDGGPAVVEVAGDEAPLPLLNALLGDLATPIARQLAITTRYTLEPSSDVLQIEQQITNRGSGLAKIGLFLTGFIFNNGLLPFVPGFGFDLPSVGGVGEFYAATASDITYVIGRPDRPINFVTSYSGILAGQDQDSLTLAPGETTHVTHLLVVGAGDLGATVARFHEAAGRPPSPVLAGRVIDGAGAPVAGARVHVVNARPDDTAPDRDYITQTRTATDGRYAVEVPSGDYRLVAAADARSPSPPVSRAAEADRGTFPVDDLVLLAPGTLAYDVRDSGGGSIPARLTVTPMPGTNVSSLPSRYGEAPQPTSVVDTIFGLAAPGTEALPPGAYRIYVSRGVEYEITSADVEIRTGESTPLSATLERSVATRGWLSTDTHLHSQLSPDSPDMFELKVAALAAEGLEMPVSTEHEAIGDFNPAIAELGLSAFIQGVVGTEVTTSVYGHFNAFPLQADPTRPGRGRIDWYQLEPAALFAAMRANPGDPFIQVNHPRWAGIGGYFASMGFDPNSFTAIRSAEFAQDFDAIEVMNHCDSGFLDSTTLPDWYAYLNRGIRKVATSGSDSHRAALDQLGYPRVYVQMPTDAPGEASVDDFRAAFRAGRLVLTCGPMLEFNIGGAQIGDLVSLPPTTTTAVTLTVRVAAPSWMSVDRLDVVMNGATVTTVGVPEASASVERWSGTIQVTPPAGRDSWILIRTSGSRPHGIWGQLAESYALTNPIFIDGNGDNRFGP
jgi:hypothetical protein